MEFHLIRVKGIAGILPDVEPGIEVLRIVKKPEVKDADAYALLQGTVVFPAFNLFCIHLRQVEQGAVSPYLQFGQRVSAIYKNVFSINIANLTEINSYAVLL